MSRLKLTPFILLVGLLSSACTGYELRPATLPASEQPSTPTETAAATKAGQTLPPTVMPTITATPAGAWLSLSPASGKPGETVQVDGYVPTPPPDADLKNSNYQTYTNLCWGGCQDGLLDEGLEMAWSPTETGHFSLSFVIPLAPWLTGNGLHALAAGDYPVTIRYLVTDSTNCPTPGPKGCMLEIQAGIPFHLVQGSSGPVCLDLTCASLSLSPANGAPGDVIQVKGWAPLLMLIGNTPAGYSGYELALEPANGAASNLFNFGQPVSQFQDGSLTATFQVPLSGSDGAALAPGSFRLALTAGGLTETKGAPAVILAPTAFEITAAPAWAQLTHAAPLWIQPADSLMSPSVSVDPANPDRLAYCAPGEIQVSLNAGKSWTSVSTTPVATLVDASDYALGQTPVACNSVILDVAHPDSYYAVFSTQNKQYGAPPIYFMGFFTSDAGKTWQPAPTPPEGQAPTMVERFGGFSTVANGIQALYLGDAAADGQPSPVLVEQTTDGGKSWSRPALACLTPAGTRSSEPEPCLRWGPAPSAISGMGAGLPQGVMASQDKGQTWASTGQSVELRMNGPHELAALSADEALIISGDAAYPLLYSKDSGQTWQALGLPSLPGSIQWNGLQLLPDGSLVAMNADSGAWYALPPAAQDWCPLNITTPGSFPVLFQASGAKAWWFSPVDQSLQSTPLTAFKCQP